MAIIGAHVLLYTSQPDAVRAIFRDVFGWRHVDSGGGWLIFAMPPAELGVHPAEGPAFHSGVRHQLSLMCDNLEATLSHVQANGISVQGQPQDEEWGTSIVMNLPGGLELLLYQPRHPTAIAT
jgi:predicted enzyme related to lactoylglutathione lyase